MIVVGAKVFFINGPTVSKLCLINKLGNMNFKAFFHAINVCFVVFALAVHYVSKGFKARLETLWS